MLEFKYYLAYVLGAFQVLVGRVKASYCEPDQDFTWSRFWNWEFLDLGTNASWLVCDVSVRL